MPPENEARPARAGDAAPDRPVPTPIAQEVARAAAAALERVLSALTGRIYSPRIKLLDIDHVRDAVGLGKSTIYDMVEKGTFPKPQRNLGKNMWRESTLIAWADANDPNQDD